MTSARIGIGMGAMTVAVVLAVAGCGGQDESPPSDPLPEVFRQEAQEEGLTRLETDGKRLFAHYCSTCHGESGAGDGQNAYNLDPPPPDFHESLRDHPPSYWRQIVEGGSAAVGRSPLCPPWGRTIASGDVDALMSYLEVLGRPDEESAQSEQANEPSP